MSQLLRLLTRLLIYTLLAASVMACQTTRQTVKPPGMVFRMAVLNKNPESVDALHQTIAMGQTAIIKIDKGFIFPLIFDLKNNAAEVDLNNNAISLAFKQDMYLSMSEEATKLSKDGRNWFDLKDLTALKNLLAIRKGALTFSMAANSSEPVAVVMTVATNAD